MEIDDITGSITGSAIRVHAALGPGLLESAYRACLRHGPVFEAQLLSHLRLKGIPAGLLINFHVLLLRDGIKRMINQFPKTL